MSKFDYICPNTLDEAIQLINDKKYKNKLIAGGTDLMVLLHHEEPNFNRVIDISHLSELKTIQKHDDQITLGAGVTFTEAINSDILKNSVPFLVTACEWVGSPQIRNTGTIGGNVANAATCADSIPVLVCIDAMVHLRGIDTERKLLVSDFIKGPNQTDSQSGEILTHFTFPIPPEKAKSIFIKLGRRNAQAISRLTIAALGRIDNQGKVDLIQITPGAATPQTRRFTEVEEMLFGKTITDDLITSASRKTAEVMINITGRRWSTEYKEPALIAITEKALKAIFPTKN